ncbi:hypothetical protein UXP70_22225 [Enterobacter cloacae]|uniref:hypothetical protein n=1 Tax=Enterobacter cloacae TaxID=550 RepID=UPI002FCEE214
MSRSINQQWSYLISELRYFAFVTPPIYLKPLFILLNNKNDKAVRGIFPADGFTSENN